MKKTNWRFASEEVSCAPCHRLPSVVFFQHLTDDTVGRGEVFIILAHADARVIYLFCFHYRFIQIRLLNPITAHNHNPR